MVPQLPPASLEVIEREITELSAHIYAANARLAMLIAEFDRRQGWGGPGLKSCAHWLTWQCALSPAHARAKVEVARAVEKLPAIAAAWSRGEVSDSAVRAMASVATPETEEALLNVARHGTGAHLVALCRAYRRVLAAVTPERARSVMERYLRFRYDDDGALLLSGRFPGEEGELIRRSLEATLEELDRERREVVEADADDAPTPSLLSDSAHWIERNADALAAMAESALSSPLRTRTAAERYQVTVMVDADTLTNTDNTRLPLRCETARGLPIPAWTARRLACDCSLVTIVQDGDGNPIDVGRKTRTIPTRIRRALEARDRHCRYPNCTARRFLEGHHLVWWVHGGETKLASLALLCGEHHDLVHRLEITIEMVGPDEFVFRRRDGSIVWPARVGPGLERVLREGNAGLGIDADTCRSKWAGERIDYGVAVSCLARQDGLDDRMVVAGDAPRGP